MQIIDHFDIKNQTFYIGPEDFDTASSNTSRRFITVGELRINDRKHSILQEIIPSDAVLKKSSEPSLSLTRREMEVVMLVSEGVVNKVIAGKLGISEWTVSTHLRRIFAKLGVDSRAEMVFRCASLIHDYKRAIS